MLNPVFKYYSKHTDIIKENLLLSEDPENIEAIHNLRLSIKRLRVVMRLVNQIRKDSDMLSSMQEINTLFKQAGNLRDLQIIGLLLKEFKLPELDPVLSNLLRKTGQRRNKYEIALAGFKKEHPDEISSKLRQALQHVDREQAYAEGISLLTILTNEISYIFHESRQEKRFHSIRRRLKDINYLNNIFDEQLPVEDSLNIGVSRLRDLADLAGFWHDHLNMQKEINNFIRKYPDRSSPSLEAFNRMIKNRKHELQQEYSCILINEMKI
ncbi:MAG: CHAD domain-containing protein [Bacteroidales bacterium]|nr:CHAD domain-containing protein [Bacteroidales bacterium]